jgi:hypothetical protein
MDRSVPTEEVLAEMRRSEPPVQYLCGTPKGRLNRLEKSLVTKPWRNARAGVKVKLLPEDNELYVFAESQDRIAKERSMRRRKLKWLWARLAQLQDMRLARDALLMKLGSAQSKVAAAWRLVDVIVDKEGAGFTYRLNRQKLKQVRRREGRYLLRTNLIETDPPHVEKRSGDPSDLPSRAATHRGARVRRLPLVLSVRHPWPTTQSPGTRTYRAQCAGEICRRADGPCAHPDHRRP